MSIFYFSPVLQGGTWTFPAVASLGRDPATGKNILAGKKVKPSLGILWPMEVLYLKKEDFMVQDTIECPKCGEIIKLSQALSKDIEADIRQKYEKQSEQKERELKEKFAKESKVIEGKLKEEIVVKNRLELLDLKSELEEKNKRLETTEKQELALRKKQRELEDREKTLKLELERTLDNERKAIIENVTKETDAAHRLKDAEKEKRLADMRKQIEDLKRKAEQGSQKTQGEVLELELEEALKREFPFDAIEPVSSGTKGGDVIQIVKTQSGRECGKILWETKRTKNWSDQWIQKLKSDKRDVKADIAVLVSEALPDGFRQFREISGVWVTDIPSAVSLSLALRVVLNQVAVERAMQTGKKEKAELVYDYMTGVEFKNRVEAIIEAFRSMHDDLNTEKRSMERAWSKREKQIQQVLLNIAGMHGDLEGLAGSALPVIKALELPSEAIQDESIVIKE